jgi:DNA-binding transcriptional ArsR family regulator
LTLSDTELDELLRALAHSERRMFLRLCNSEPVAAGDLAERSTLSLATVSEHLKVLRKAQLVTVEKDGRYWRYRADAGRIEAVLAALGHWSGDKDGA